jgi:putative aldouronate transport system substrate-binding protein
MGSIAIMDRKHSRRYRMSRTGTAKVVLLASALALGLASVASAQTLEPYTLRLALLTGQPQRDADLVAAEMTKITKPAINATIELLTYGWDNYPQQKDLLIASGEQVDLCFTASWWGYATDVTKKAFVEITDQMLNTYLPKTKAQINPAYLSGPRIAGKLYAIPTEKDLGALWGFTMKKELVDRYGIDPNGFKRIEDLEPTLRMLKEKEPGIAPMYVSAQNSIGPMNMFYINNENIVTDLISVPFYGPPTAQISAETPEYISLIKLTRDWNRKGYFNRDALTTRDLQADRRAGKFFMSFGQLKPGSAEEQAIANGYPMTQGSFVGTRATVSTGDTGGAMLAITRNTKNAARAAMFLELLHTNKELVNIVAYGIRGRHYVGVGDNVVDFSPGLDPKASGWNHGVSWAITGNQFLTYTFKNEDPRKWDHMREFNNSARPSQLMGFNFDDAAVKNQVAALRNVGDRYKGQTIAGVADFETYYPKYLTDLRNAGIEVVRREVQRQIDAFLAARK